MVNVYEVYYDACRADGEAKAKELLADIEKLPIKIIRNIDRDVIIKAARFKVGFSISLADSIALGLGEHLKAKVVTDAYNSAPPIWNPCFRGNNSGHLPHNEGGVGLYTRRYRR